MSDKNVSDAKEWVTIKIPKAVRDDAREDPRTYGEIMRAGLDSSDPEFDLKEEAFFERLSALEDVAGHNNIQREEFRRHLKELNDKIDGIEQTLEGMGGR